MNVVIVESPAKAKTINKYLGPGYTVLASFGHVRDLPAKDGSVLPDEDFAMTWKVDSKSSKRLNEIAAAVKDADHLFLATDPDREGEAISWHVLKVLEKKKALKKADVKRVVFNEITKTAILKAMAEPRDIDDELVNAYMARRALDYLVGFTLSPVLWRKLPGARSAGRVQSVALRLICDRELEIDKFEAREYWSILGNFSTTADDPFEARLAVMDGRKLAKHDIGDSGAAEAAVAAVKAAAFTAKSVERKPTRRHPQPPFTTSTVQQEAARKLGFSASHTMSVAQALYEGKTIDGDTTGLITYMRTDGVSIAGEAIAAARQLIGQSWGAEYVPDVPRAYKSKAKNAQEAHEAIRPTVLSRRPSDVARYLNDDERRLYELIWQRTIASQMESARLEQTTIVAESPDGSLGFRASGSVMQFDGFLKLYQEGRDDLGKGDKGDTRNGDNQLPRIEEGEKLNLGDVNANQHFTEPPPRFTEASLVKKMEELGIGRPSTYASTLSVLRQRNYVQMDKKRFIPEDKGHLVTAFLEAFFGRYVEYDFTANLEQQLDEISAGKLEWKGVLREFWTDFHPKTEEVLGVRNSIVLDALNDHLGVHLFKAEEPGADPRKCPSCEDGRVSLKTGRYGAFIGCSNYPECRFTRQFLATGGADAIAADGPVGLGTDPATEMDVTLRTGRFGPYVQLGEAEEDKKPKRSSIPKDMDASAIDLEKALKLLSLPREVGLHPETGKPINASIGRYGPYVVSDGVYGKLSGTEEVFEIGLNRAVALIAESKKSPKGSRTGTIKELGDHPEDGKPVRVMKGRFGPYVNHNRLNATVPRGTEPEALELAEALELLKAKAEKDAGKKPTKKSAKKKPAKKKAAKKKAPAKKASTKKAAAE